MDQNTSKTITLNTDKLKSEQLRILKQIHYLSIDVMKTDCEVDFFEKSSMLMKLMANAISHSNFGKADEHGFDSIAYAKQAIEYSMENLEDELDSGSIEDYDH